MMMRMGWRAVGPMPCGLRPIVAGVILATLAVPGGARAFATLANETCKEGEVFRWRGGPPSWYLNEDGSRTLEFDQVEAILQGAFTAWSEPCCSGFTSRYGGKSKLRLHAPVRENVIMFEGTKWPPEAGDSRGTIGATLAWSNDRCAIIAMLIIFNEIDYTFHSTDQDLERMDVDLRWVAAHEVGHWLGLGHSEDPGATMRIKYTSDLPYEGIYADDVAGVCAIYPGSCESCERREDCPSDSVCRDGSCVASECRNTLDCPVGSICREDLCVPGCRVHSECPAGQGCLEGSCVARGARCEKHVDCDDGEACVGGFCRAQPETCSTCKDCRLDTDCGLYETCVPTVRSNRGSCMNPCETDRDCVGNTVCRQPPGAPSPYCLDPIEEGSSAFCRAGFACTIEEPGPALGCALLGRDCTKGSFGCGDRADTCVDLEDGPKCSCTCRSDSECGVGGRCLLDPTTGLDSCYPEESLLPCGGSFCTPGLQCADGTCSDDPCAGVSCSPGTSCVAGTCVAPEPPVEKRAKPTCAAAGASALDAWPWGAGIAWALSRRASARRDWFR